MRIPVLILATALLVACGGGGGGKRQTPVLPDYPDSSGEILWNQRSLVYAYPAPGQTEVVPGAPIVLRFSHPLASPATAASLFTLRDLAAAQNVPFTLKVVDDGYGVVLQPNAALKPASRYQVIGETVALKDATTGETGTITLQATGQPAVIFRTRAALQGAATPQTLAGKDSFTVVHQQPNAGMFPLDSLNQAVPLMDFSSLRLQLSQPVDARTVSYGGTVRLEKDGTLVAARLLVSGSRLTVDPVADLEPGASYTLRLTTGLRSTLGKALTPGAYAAYTFTPRDTGMAAGRSSRIKIDIPAGGESLLTGAGINQVPVASPLLGQGDRAPRPQAGGSLYADLAYAPNFSDFKPAVVPLRVPRDNLLSAASLDVLIDGKVPAGLQTGNLTIKLTSDANGLLLPNKYSNSVKAPALVTLEMDIALSAQDATSNGAFTQDIMHVAVSGVANIDQEAQLLTINALGVIELNILGVDNAVGVLSLKLVSELDKVPGAMPADTTAPLVQSWVPGDTVNNLPGGEFLRPGDPVIVNFSEVMDAASFREAGAVTLTADGVAEPFSSRLDGASLVISPTTPLRHGVAYQLGLGTQIKDLSGNALAASSTLAFSLPALSADRIRPPIVLSTYPGYPCAIASGSRNLSGGIQGRCAGGKTSGLGTLDDLLPLPAIDPDREIRVHLSQSVAPESVRLGTSCGAAASFRVERVDASGNCQGVVAGAVAASPREILFRPDEPWVKGQLYRYVLGSNGSLTSSAADCTGTQAICGSNGLPLQTQLLAQSLSDARNAQRGGPNMEIYFRGGDPLGGTSIGLRVLPVLDVNANFRLDAGERRSLQISESGSLTGVACRTGQGSDTPATTGRCLAPNGALLQPDRITTGKSFSGAATAFSLGCASGVGAEDENASAGRDCQGNQFLLISASLGARLGSSVVQDGQDAIEVFIDPSIVVTSGAQIYADLGITPTATPITAALCSLPLANLLCDGLGLLTGVLDTVIDGLLPIKVRDETNLELPIGQVYTGPLVFRMRHPADNGPIRGYIRSEGGKLVLETQLDLYTDIPELNAVATIVGQPVIPIDHAVRSNNDLTASANATKGSGTVKVRGEVSFLPDGRMTVRLANIEPVRLSAQLSALGGLLAGELKVRVPTQRFIIDASLAPLKPALQ